MHHGTAKMRPYREELTVPNTLHLIGTVRSGYLDDVTKATVPPGYYGVYKHRTYPNVHSSDEIEERQSKGLGT